MSDQKIEVLVAGPQAPALMTAVEREYSVHKLWLAADRDAYLREHGGAIRAIVTNAPVGADAELIDALPKLEIISSFGVGLDAIDLEAARRRGVIVTYTPGVLDDAVADLGLALLLAVSRRVCEADRFVRVGKWLQGKFPLGTSLRGKTCGIFGMGNIGRGVAIRGEAFGMKIAYFNPRPKPDLSYKYYDDAEALARDADFLVLTLPGGEATHHLVDARILAALGPSGFLVNIARGTVVDQAALVRALRSGGIAGAAIDVFEDEPNVPTELIALENVVLTPHVGSGTHETRNAMSELTFANLHAHFTGKPVLTPIK
jgi:lactate dehydrogenase-like 2-hydroxyacid dehydrogenase